MNLDCPAKEKNRKTEKGDRFIFRLTMEEELE
jgi:hypothetical protein